MASIDSTAALNVKYSDSCSATGKFIFRDFFDFYLKTINQCKKINDINISTLDQLITILRNKRAGDAITVEILRGGNTITLDFTLDLRPSDV